MELWIFTIRVRERAYDIYKRWGEKLLKAYFERMEKELAPSDSSGTSCRCVVPPWVMKDQFSTAATIELGIH